MIHTGKFSNYILNKKQSSPVDFPKQNGPKRLKKLGAGQYVKKPYTLEKIGIAVKNELEK